MAAASKRKASASPSPDPDEPIDLPALQASLDDSFSLARSLVESWIPKDLDPSWDTNSGASGVAELELRNRPARLGLGASASAHHAARAEELKLRNQLLNHSKKHKAVTDAEDPQPSTSGVKRKAEDEEEESEDEEESRAGAIRSKGSQVSASAPVNGKGKPSKKATTSTPSIANPFVPSSAPAISASSFYSLSAASSKSAPSPAAAPASTMEGLSKNQRKKERERQRKLALAEQARKESLAEEQSNGNVDPPAVESSPSNSPVKKKKEQRVVRPPFAPVESSPGTSANEASPAPSTSAMGSKGKPLFNPASSPMKPRAEEGGDVDMDESAEVEPELDVAASPPVKSENGSMADGEGKKKKRKKRKKNKAGGGTAEETPLLNLQE